MPSATSRRLYEDQLPSFMSVYGLENGLDHSTVTIVDPNLVMEDSKLPGNSQPVLRPGALPSESVHKHNDSTSTAESADSSPTTTVSCTDSSDLSDPSPSSSPDSPVNLIPLRTFAPTAFGGMSGMASLSISSPALARPMTSPAPRRPKNMKGLSIQPPFGGSLSSTEVSEPSSPVFIKPKIPAMKRKPSQLSLKTSTSDLIMRTTQEVPSSPTVAPILQRRALKHSTSSPHMLAGLKSATFGPAGGMTIPTVLERNETGLSSFLRPPKPPVAPGLGSTIAEEDSPIRTQVANRAAYEVEPFHDVEGDEDQKSPGYPDGPIAIYGDNVYLYLEPTAEEASRFDVVINVAREVHNPFKIGQKLPSEDEQKPADDSPIPDTAVTTASFATAFEYFPDTPTTPKAQSFKEPEYIHMPWDHNTDISPELMSLCETIERKTREGKKVLVHCQQGASRSASLIIAYGLYQNPELSVNDAYHNAQAKSRWISPNMRLMYCLQDFQKEVSKRRLSPGSGLKLRSGRSPTHRATMSVDQIELPHKEPLTAPLPVEDPVSSGRNGERSPVRGLGSVNANLSEPISPGPSSAPSSFSWTEKEDESDPGKYGRFNLDSMLMPSQPDSGFASSVSSFSKPPPSPGFPPASITVTKAPPSPGFGSFTLSMPPKSPGFAPPGFAPMSFSRPPPSPGFAPMSFSRPPPSPRLAPAPIELSRPPMSPGFPPSDPFAKPPPSPGFGAHRFGSSESFGFAPLHFAPPPKPVEKKMSLSPEGTFGFSHLTLSPPEPAPKPVEIRPASSDGSGAFGFTPLSLALPPKPAKKKEVMIPERTITVKRSFCDDGSLMSPRVEVMTSNPIHQAFPGLSGPQLVEVPPTPPDALFSPRETMFPRDPFYPFGRPPQNEDPRSPPTLGETPIVRSIDDMI
ncbi:dual specificity phosphatase [Cladorrhinum sp. PSN332]|nr:dual specificity phosphatase [Cladorrhinum sp. PSN332]